MKKYKHKDRSRFQKRLSNLGRVRIVATLHSHLSATLGPIDLAIQGGYE